MDYSFSEDLKAIRELLDLSQTDLAYELGTQQITISRNEQEHTVASAKLIEQAYSFAFSKNIRLNKLKEMFWFEEMSTGHKMLFHGSKRKIVGNISVHAGRGSNDFGPGFYTGEGYNQAVSFVSGFDKASLYILDFDPTGLKAKEYSVDCDWMLTIAYYRGTLEKYRNHPSIIELIAKSRDCDYIIAPIADNRMFQIINSFISGEITDEQCKHCLAATNLGKQYVFVSDKSINNLKILEHCYLAKNEREYFQSVRSADAKLGDDKVRLARIEYRGKGKYIDEILE